MQSEDEDTVLLYQRELAQTWHAHDNVIGFFVTGSSSTGRYIRPVSTNAELGLFPADIPAHILTDGPDPELIVMNTYINAAREWSIRYRQSPSIFSLETDVRIAGYWEPNSAYDLCGGTVSCFVLHAAYSSPAHIGNSNEATFIYVEDPPLWSTDYRRGRNVRQWTTNLLEYESNRDSFVYLPGALTHAFGHIQGLLDGGTGIMRGHSGDIYAQGTIGPDDRSASNSIYGGHAAHSE